MTKLIKKLPIPIAGLMLALAAIGNLFASYGSVYKNIFSGISAIVFILIVTKVLTDYRNVIKGLSNPVIASVAPTFSMGVMILSTYIRGFLPKVSLVLWMFAIVLHFLLIINFTKKFILNFKIERIFPSSFVVYVGIVVGSVTAPAYNLLSFGQALFWFGFISYLVLLPIVIYRVFFVKEIKEPVLPTITIFAAPASLCLAGYMSSFQEKNMLIVGFLTSLALIMTLSVIIYLPKMLKTKFYPSFSAFTFPFVISAIAIKKTNVFLNSTGSPISWLKYVVTFEEFFALLIVLYVSLGYARFLLARSQDGIVPSTK